METGIVSLLLAAAVGIGAGILYDGLRPVRRAVVPLAAALLDGVFCALAACALFFLTMSSKSGALGLWEMSAAAAAVLLYFHSFSRFFSSFFAAAFDKQLAAARKAKNAVKKSIASIKKFFQKTRECFIMKR